METTIIQRMVMRVRLSDVSDRSSAIEYVGQGTWFDGKSFVVAQYKANPSMFYFFVYDSFEPAHNYFDEMDKGIDKEIWQLNPDNGYYAGTTYLYSQGSERLFKPFSANPVVENSPTILFEIR